MRTMWKGYISFGLLNIPVRMGVATRKQQLSFKNLHQTCHTPIKQKRYCPHCQVEISFEEIVKGYPYEDDTFVILRDEDLQELPLKTLHTITILDFIELHEIDPLYYDKTYYLTPKEGGEKPYLILKEVMDEKGRVAVTKITIRQKESLAIIRSIGPLLGLETIFYPKEIQRDETDWDGMKRSIQILPKEREMAKELLDHLTSPFQPEKYRDEYYEALLQVIQKKIEGRQIQKVKTDVPGDKKVVDIMTRLQESIEEVKKERETHYSS